MAPSLQERRELRIIILLPTPEIGSRSLFNISVLGKDERLSNLDWICLRLEKSYFEYIT